MNVNILIQKLKILGEIIDIHEYANEIICITQLKI
jgi:hypothetical protein